MVLYLIQRMDYDKRVLSSESKANSRRTRLNSPRCLIGLLLLLMCTHVEAYITSGGTVTASVWETQYQGQGNFPKELVDGIFQTVNVVIGGQMYGIPLTTYAAGSWMNIQLLNRATIDTVLIVMRENCCPEQNANTELYVGDTTTTLVACGANPQGSGIYSCGGKSGSHLRLGRPITYTQRVILGEIRAYSVAPTPITEFTVNQSTYSCTPGVENLFTWPNNMRGTPLQPFVTGYTGCRQFLQGGSPAYYQVNFNQSRFIHVITLIGSDYNTYAYSQNWRLLVLVNGVYTIYGQYARELDKYGKEIPIGIFTTSFRIERSDGLPLGFFWVGIFSTLTECAGTFDWSQSWQTWPVLLYVPSTTTNYIARAQLSTYALTHTLTQLDGSALPSYVTYDPSTQTVSVTPPANTQISLQLIATAKLSYDTCFKSSRYPLTINICTTTLASNPATLSLTLEIQGSVLTSPLPTITPTTAIISYALAAGSPTFFQIYGTNLITDATAIAGTYNLTVIATDSVCGLSMNIQAAITLYDCRPSGFTLSSASVASELDSQAQTVTWSQDTKNSLCGNYSVTSLSSILQISGQNITVLTSMPQTTTATLTLTRNSVTTMTITASLMINVYDCRITSFALSQPSITLELNSTANTLTWSQNAVDPLCGTYTVTSDTTKITSALPPTLVVSTLTAESYSATLTLTRVNNQTMTSNASLQVIIYDCQPTGFTLTTASVALEVNSPAPAITWTADAKNSLCGTYSLTSDSTIAMISGQNLALQTAAATVQIVTLKLIRDFNQSMMQSALLQVTLYDCRPSGFTLSSTTISSEIGSLAQTVTWSQDTKNPLCGTYSVTSTLPSNLQISGQNITVLTSSAVTTTGTLTLLRDSNTTMTTSVTITVNVYNCQPTGFVLPVTTVILELNGLAQTMTWQADAKNPLCGTYLVSSDSTLVSVTGQTIAVQSKTIATQQVTLTLLRKDNPSMMATARLYVKINDLSAIIQGLNPAMNKTMMNSTILVDSSPVPLAASNATDDSNKTSELNNTASFNATALVYDLVKGDAQANQTEALAEQINQVFSEAQAGASAQFLLQSLQLITQPQKHMKVSLRFADIKISDVSRNSLVTLKMSEPVRQVNEGTKIEPELLQVEYIKNSEEVVQMTKWELVGYSETQIQLQLTFSEPLLVSAGTQNDVIQVSLARALLLPVNNPYKYEPIRRDLSQSSLKVVVTTDLPVLVKSESDFVKLDSAHKTIQKSTLATVVIPMVAQVAMKGAMKKLWFYFNTMQLADTFTEFENVKAPANVEMISTAYKDIIHVQMLPPQVIDQAKAYLGLKTNSTNSNQSHRSLLSAPTSKSITATRVAIGSVGGCIVVGLIAIYILRKRIWYRLSRSMQKKLISVYHRIFWNMFIRTLLEMFYPMMLLSLKALRESERPSRAWSEIVKVTVFSVFLVFTFIFMVEKREEVDDEAFKERYGAYLTNVETFLKPSAVHFPAVFMLRRLVMAITITFLKFNLVTQVLCGVHSSLLMLSWLVLVKPFDSEFKNYLECTNESIVLVLSYFGFLFSDYVESPIARYSFGFFYLGLIALGLAINVLGMVWQTSTELLKVYRRWRHKKLVQTQRAVEQAQEKEQPAMNLIKDNSFERKESESASQSSIIDSDYNLSSQSELLVVPPPASAKDREEPVLLNLANIRKQENKVIPSCNIARFVGSRHKKIDSQSILRGHSFSISDSDSNHQDGITLGELGDVSILYGRQSVKPMLQDIQSSPMKAEIKSRGFQARDWRQSPNNFMQASESSENEDFMDVINQADPLDLAKLYGEKHLAEVKVRLKDGASATISQLLSQVREMQERNQQRDIEDLEDLENR